MKLLIWDQVLWQVLFNALVWGHDVCNVILREGQVLRALINCTSLGQPHNIQWILPFCICWVKLVCWYHSFHFLRNQTASAQKSTRHHLQSFLNFLKSFLLFEFSLVSPVKVWLTLSFFLSLHWSASRREQCLSHSCVARKTPDFWFHPTYVWQQTENTKVSVKVNITANIYMSLCLYKWWS